MKARYKDLPSTYTQTQDIESYTHSHKKNTGLIMINPKSKYEKGKNTKGNGKIKINVTEIVLE